MDFTGDISTAHPAVWRFIVLGDPTVRMFMVRDSDNDLGMREKSAVDDWIRSGKPFHAMRDHPLHVTDVLAGEWGGNNELIGYQRGHNLTLEILRKARSGVGQNGLHLYGADQDILADVVYGKYRDGFLVHSSYNCELFRDSVPFPVQRSNVTGEVMEYVGMPMQCNFADGVYEFLAGDESRIYGKQDRRPERGLFDTYVPYITANILHFFDRWCRTLPHAMQTFIRPGLAILLSVRG